MHALTPARRVAALVALSLGGFGIGITEFASMGVLPDIAQDLLPDFAAHPEAEISRAGILITLYAVGVVVGAPLFTILAARASQAKLLFWMLALFVVSSLATVVAPTFELLAAARFVSGLPHAAYFGAAALLAARILGPGAQGRGIAIVLAGLPIANIFGVPLATAMGQALGWRSAYALVAAIFALVLVLALAFVPRAPGNPSLSARGSLAGLRNVRVWIMIALASLGFSGFFALYSYIAEVTTRVTGLSPEAVPWVLACFGVGMTLGNFIGGWAADRSTPRTLVIGFVAFIGSLLLYLAVAADPVGLFVSVFLAGLTSSVLMPATQSRFIRISAEAALLGAALSHACLNLGNALGAWLGGAVIAAGFGYLSPGWVGIASACLGLVFVALSLWVSRRDRRRFRDTTGIPLPGDAVR
ncbi:MAG: MFS transporter [Leucobacter sp.]|nr:MFS transporter [Leucobacter sp.]